jgi:ABC-2 type transport system ATP-binding protein
MKLELKNLSKNFSKNEVLKNIDFTFEEGKIYGLLGRNGSGKTTLFNCINDDLSYNGDIYLLDDKDKKKELKSDNIGYTVSNPIVPEFLTGKEFLTYFIDINKDRIPDLKTPEEYFDMMNLDKKDMNKLLKDYSFGMKTKIQMLVNIILNTKVLLLDEPLTSLDVVASEEMKEHLLKLKKNHILIFSTHIMELALELCDEIVILNEGKLHLVPKKNKNKEYIIDYLKGDIDDK